MLALMGALVPVLPDRLRALFFGSSGAETVGTSIELARGVAGRPNVIVFQGGSHGRTVGAVGLTTSKAAYRVGHRPLMGGVWVAPYPCAYQYEWGEKETLDWSIRELQRLLRTETAPEETAAVLVEPILRAAAVATLQVTCEEGLVFALGKARGVGAVFGGHDEREETLNQLRAELDGCDTQGGAMILAATNGPEILDSALLRPGRSGRQVVIDRPHPPGSEKILRGHGRHVKLAADLALGLAAAWAPGFVGADLANLVNEAAPRAARPGRAAVTLADFDEAIDHVVAGLEHTSRVIGPRGVAALGYTQPLPTGDCHLMTRAELLDQLDVLLGGRVAEAIVFGAEIRALLEAAQARVRQTFTATRPVREGLAKQLIDREAVDRATLVDLRASRSAHG